MAIFLEKALYRCLVFDKRHNDFAVISARLLFHNDIIIVKNARLNHAFTADSENKVFTISDKIGWKRHQFFCIFFSEYRHTGGDAADNRNTANGNICYRFFMIIRKNAHSTRLHGVTMKKPLFFKAHQMSVNSRSRF